MIASDQLVNKQNELEKESNTLIAAGGKVSGAPRRSILMIIYFPKNIHFVTSLMIIITLIQVFASVVPYDVASELCGGLLPSYIVKVMIFLIISN